jgi:hypothetical protein
MARTGYNYALKEQLRGKSLAPTFALPERERPPLNFLGRMGVSMGGRKRME